MTGLPGGFRGRYVKARALELIAKDDMVMIDAELMTVQRAHVSYQSLSDVATIQEKTREAVLEQIAPMKAHTDVSPKQPADDVKTDMVNHPPHYTSHPSGVECIEITEHMGFCLGNAIKYLWRADTKGATLEDLKKAQWYLNREIQLREVRNARPPILSK